MGSQCYLPPDTSERAPPSPQPVSRNSIYLPRRDGRLSWPRLPGNAPAGNRTRDLSITSPTPYHYTNRATLHCRGQAGTGTAFISYMLGDIAEKIIFFDESFTWLTWAAPSSDAASYCFWCPPNTQCTRMESSTNFIADFRLAIHMQNLEKSGNLTLVREN